MSANSKIEWTDHTFNPWRGCTPVSPGCAHCYAAALSKRVGGPDYRRGVPRQRTKTWGDPVKWNKAVALASGCQLCHNQRTDPRRPDGRCWYCLGWEQKRQRVFCASLADWLDDEVPIEWLADLLALIHATPHLDWLLLTKRPQNWSDRLHFALRESNLGLDFEGWLSGWLDGYPPTNVWVGTTVEDQQRADERIPHLLAIPARVRFLSCEPLLGPVDLTGIPVMERRDANDPVMTLNALTGHVTGIDEYYEAMRIHWVIAGGESGSGARPMQPAWARGLRDQCESASVPFLFKQWGEHDAQGRRVGKMAAGRVLDGETLTAFPEVRP